MAEVAEVGADTKFDTPNVFFFFIVGGKSKTAVSWAIIPQGKRLK